MGIVWLRQNLFWYFTEKYNFPYSKKKKKRLFYFPHNHMALEVLSTPGKFLKMIKKYSSVNVCVITAGVFKQT